MEETRTDQRTYTSFMYKAGSWKHEERVVAKRQELLATHEVVLVAILAFKLVVIRPIRT